MHPFSLEWNIQMSISCFVKIKLEPVDVGSGPFNVSPHVYQLGHCRACYESSTTWWIFSSCKLVCAAAKPAHVNYTSSCQITQHDFWCTVILNWENYPYIWPQRLFPCSFMNGTAICSTELWTKKTNIVFVNTIFNGQCIMHLNYEIQNYRTMQLRMTHV